MSRIEPRSVWRHFWMDQDPGQWSAMEFLTWYHGFIEFLIHDQPEVMEDRTFTKVPQTWAQEEDRRSQRRLDKEWERWSDQQLAEGWQQFARVWQRALSEAGLRYLLWQERRRRAKRIRSVTDRVCGFCCATKSPEGWSCFRQPECFAWWNPQLLEEELPPLPPRKQKKNPTNNKSHDEGEEEEEGEAEEEEEDEQAAALGLERRRKLHDLAQLYQSTELMRDALKNVCFGSLGCVWVCEDCLAQNSLPADNTQVHWKLLRKEEPHDDKSRGKKKSSRPASSLLEHADTHRPTVCCCSRCHFPYWQPNSVVGNAPAAVPKPVTHPVWGVCLQPQIPTMGCAGKINNEGVQGGGLGIYTGRFHRWVRDNDNNNNNNKNSNSEETTPGEGSERRKFKPFTENVNEYRNGGLCDCCIDWLISRRRLSDRTRIPNSQMKEGRLINRERISTGPTLRSLLNRT